MIDQLFYRRDQSSGYNEYHSSGISGEDAHKINLILNNLATYIPSVDSGQDAPMFIFPVKEQNKYCIGRISSEFYGGRQNQVQHGLLMSEKEYLEKTKNPEQIFGFSNKNFISVKTNRKNEMVSLYEFVADENTALNVNQIVQTYNLNNESFIKFLNIVHTTLSKNKGYTCGITMDTARSSVELMRHLGYLFMSMLPYPLRGKVSFGSAGAPENVEITIQILRTNDNKNVVDATYNLDTQELSVKSRVKAENFYLEELMSMSDEGLKVHFEKMDEYRHALGIVEGSANEYVVFKLLKLDENSDLFATEKTQEQLSFIKDVLALDSKNSHLIKETIIKLLSYIDVKEHMEAFAINYDLYAALDLKADNNLLLKSKIERNLLQNFAASTDEEKIKLFKQLYCLSDAHEMFYEFIGYCLSECNDTVSLGLIEEYALLFNESYHDDFSGAIFDKIEALFKKCTLDDKCSIWNTIIDKCSLQAQIGATYALLYNTDESFQKKIIHSLIKLYSETTESDSVLRYHDKIKEVFIAEDDDYIVTVLKKYREADNKLDELWLEGYECIKDKNSLVSDASFMNVLEYKYYHSDNENFKTLYIDYVLKLSQEELERKIHDLYEDTSHKKENTYLISCIVSLVVDLNMRLSVATLKELTQIVNDDRLIKYIRDLYLAQNSDDCNEIYEYLEKNQKVIFCSERLQKESLASYDVYYATKLSENDVLSQAAFHEVLSDMNAMSYRNHSYEQLKKIYIACMEKEFSKAHTDTERYDLCCKYNEQLSREKNNGFVQKYDIEIKKRYIIMFWNKATLKTFEYKNRQMYLTDLLDCDECISNESYLLAKKIDRIFKSYPYEWNEVCGILLSDKEIPDVHVRARIREDFIKQYKSEGYDLDNQNYISLKYVDVNTGKMDYQPFYAELQECDCTLLKESIVKEMPVLKYISNKKVYKDELKKYKNYRSEYPAYYDIYYKMLSSQVIIWIMLIANEIYYTRALGMTEDMGIRNMYLVVTCCIFGGIVLFVSIITIYALRLINLRDSHVFDIFMYGLLDANFILSFIAVLLGLKMTSLIISIVITTALMGVAIGINVLCNMAIKKKREQAAAMKNGYRR